MVILPSFQTGLMKEQVFRNVAQCQAIWQGNLGKKNRGIHILFNERTGAIQLASLPIKEQVVESKEWVHAEIKFERKKRPHLYLANPKGKPIDLTKEEAAIALIAVETLQAIEQLENVHHKADLPHVESPMSHMEMEKRLSGRRVGTYLVSGADSFVEQVAKSLSQSNQAIVMLYVLTILEEKERLVQYLVVACKWGWTILQDLPDLMNPIYRYSPDFTSLLETLLPGKKHLLQIAGPKRAKQSKR